jgi:sortase A
LSAIVTEGVTSSVLRRAVGHVPTSAWPGESGHVALALQCDSPLERLEELHAGDVVVLTSASGRHLYAVEWTVPLRPGTLETLGDPGYPACTLVTERFVARGQLVR